MKVPTVGTTVFSPIISSAATGTALTTNFPVDLQMTNIRGGDGVNTAFSARLTGVNTTAANVNTVYLVSSSTASEVIASVTRAFNNTGFQMPSYFAGVSNVFLNFQRAPGFFDVVCYTGTGSATTQTHNLGAVPELMIVKSRSNTQNWFVYSGNLGNTIGTVLNLTNASGDFGSTLWNSTTPTSSVFSLGTSVNVNNSGSTYVAYLFATCPGVSKVGSYSGTGATQTIDCGFTGGARFVLIRRTDSTGDWYVWDTARGMVAGTDPSLLLNTTAAEVNANSVYTTGVGFQIVSTAAGINASGGTYIFLAVA
jgi:hypothetical protein